MSSSDEVIYSFSKTFTQLPRTNLHAFFAFYSLIFIRLPAYPTYSFSNFHSHPNNIYFIENVLEDEPYQGFYDLKNTSIDFGLKKQCMRFDE